MTSKNSKHADMLAAISNTQLASPAPTPAAAVAESKPDNTAVVSPQFAGSSPNSEVRSRKSPPPTGKGKGLNFYMGPADSHKIRQIAAFVASQGLRVSDSNIIKAALRLAQLNSGFLAAYREVVESDGRRAKK